MNLQMLLFSLMQHPQFGPMLQQLFSGGSLFGGQQQQPGSGNFGLSGPAAAQPGFGLSGAAAAPPPPSGNTFNPTQPAAPPGTMTSGAIPSTGAGGGIHTMPVAQRSPWMGRLGGNVPGTEGYMGDMSMLRNPNQGGFGGGGLSEMQMPGISSGLYGPGSFGGLGRAA